MRDIFFVVYVTLTFVSVLCPFICTILNAACGGTSGHSSRLLDYVDQIFNTVHVPHQLTRLRILAFRVAHAKHSRCSFSLQF